MVFGRNIEYTSCMVGAGSQFEDLLTRRMVRRRYLDLRFDFRPTDVVSQQGCRHDSHSASEPWQEHLTVLSGLGREDLPDPVDPARAAAALVAVDPQALNDGQLLDYLASAGRMMSWLTAVQYEAAARFADKRPTLPSETASRSRLSERQTSKWAGAEVAAVLHTTRSKGDQLLCQGVDLVEQLPGVLALHREGCLDLTRVQAILKGLQNTPRHLWAQIEADILPVAAALTAQGLVRRTRRSAEKINPEPLAVRHQRARQYRDVWFQALPDGMAEIGARLPAVAARRYFETIEVWARHVRCEGEPATALTASGRPSRAMNEFRADILMDLLDAALEIPTARTPRSQGAAGGQGPAPRGIGAAPRRQVRASRGICPWPPAQVAVTVGVQTLMGLNEEPGHLDGYGPIPPDQARELAGSATSWLRILTHPEKGTVLSIGRARYKPTRDLRRWIETRDQTCRGIGCDRSARFCDLDHTTPYHRITHAADGTVLPLGGTDHANLGAFSTYCHHLKDDPDTGWSVSQPSPGTFVHTSPTGRTYRRDPEPPPF